MNALPPEVAAIVDAAGGVPRPYDSEMHWRRFHHNDLADLGDDEIEAERILVMVAWAALVRCFWRRSDDPTLAWFTERRAAVTAAIERRKRQERPR